MEQTWKTDMQNQLKRIADNRSADEEDRSIRDRLKSIFGREKKDPGYRIQMVVQRSDSSDFEQVGDEEVKVDLSEPLETPITATEEQKEETQETPKNEQQ